MRNKYHQEFKDEAIRQVIEKGYSVVDVARRLDISINLPLPQHKNM